MKILLSTLTVQSYENKKRLMNLHYKPIVFFKDCCPFSHRALNNIRWAIHSEKIGKHDFEIAVHCDSPFKIRDDRSYMQFDLSVRNVPFQYDLYECKLFFSAVLDSPFMNKQEIDFVSWGVVNTRWSKGLN